MKLDRLILDLLHFIRCWLWSEESRAEVPFRALREYEVRGRGRLQHIEGRTTPRAVDTWRFCPYSHGSEYLTIHHRPPDVHIYLDWHTALALTPDEERPVRFYLKQPTHSIYLFHASHHCDSRGLFDVEYINHADLNFMVGAEQSFEAIERKAKRAAAKVAKLVALYHINQHMWDREFLQIHYRVTRVGRPFYETYAYKEWGE